MVVNFYKLIKMIINDISKFIIMVLMSPIAFISRLISKSYMVEIPKNLILWYLIYPVWGFLYYIKYIIFIKPLQLYQHKLLIDQLANDPRYFNEIFNVLEYRSISNKKNLYKFLLYNFNQIDKTTFLPNPLIEQDDFFSYIALKKSILPHGWRTSGYQYLYEKDYYHQICQDIFDLYFYKPIKYKFMMSFKNNYIISILFYRWLKRRFLEDLEIFSLKLYYYSYRKFNTKNLLIIVTIVWSLFYFTYNTVFLCFYKFFLNNLYKILSLNEEGTERSLIYSKSFGFSGNLYLERGHFLTSWDMNLLEKDVGHNEQYRSIYANQKHPSSNALPWDYEDSFEDYVQGAFKENSYGENDISSNAKCFEMEIFFPFTINRHKPLDDLDRKEIIIKELEEKNYRPKRARRIPHVLSRTSIFNLIRDDFLHVPSQKNRMRLHRRTHLYDLPDFNNKYIHKNIIKLFTKWYSFYFFLYTLLGPLASYIHISINFLLKSKEYSYINTKIMRSYIPFILLISVILASLESIIVFFNIINP